MQNERQIRTQLAIATMALTRAQLRIILRPDQQLEQSIGPNAFPRSKTFRWALALPVRRWIGSGILNSTLSRLLLARLIGFWMFGRRA